MKIDRRRRTSDDKYQRGDDPHERRRIGNGQSTEQQNRECEGDANSGREARESWTRRCEVFLDDEKDERLDCRKPKPREK